MQKTFAQALALILEHEGGYSNHPKDTGGATNFGVIQRVYDDWRRRKGQVERSVREITQAEVRDIYRFQYADAIRFDLLPAGLDYAVFDGAVNSGPGQSAKWLQRALRPAYAGAIDGLIGVGTLGAADSVDVASAIDVMLDLRLAMLKGLKTWPTFGTGWGRRVAGVRKNAKAIAAKQG